MLGDLSSYLPFKLPLLAALHLVRPLFFFLRAVAADAQQTDNATAEMLALAADVSEVLGSYAAARDAAADSHPEGEAGSSCVVDELYGAAWEARGELERILALARGQEAETMRDVGHLGAPESREVRVL